LVVDDNPGFRDSLISLLDTDELTVVGQASTGLEALELVTLTSPDVILMDVRMPGMNGIETTRKLKDLQPSVGIVALTGFEDQWAVRDMLVAGASCYVLKDSDGDEILKAIRQAAMGGGVLSPEVTPGVIEELSESLERERRRTRQLEMAQEALIERAARRHELIARLGHELRTPVTVILGMAQVLSRGSAGADQQEEIIATIVDRAQALTRLVQRFEAAVEAGLTEWADVNEIAAEVAVAFPGVQVRSSPAAAMANINRTAAHRILEELVENGLAFSASDRPVKIDVSVVGGVPLVRVIDEGRGIDASALDRIFDPLEQAEELNTRVHQGVGLGLTIARTSARAMDGDVTLESTGPEGSTFLWTVSRAAVRSI
jgi:signal transduction histidine kinase